MGNLKKRKFQDTLFIALLVIITTLLSAESSLYIQLFPQLITYLNIEENSVDYILRANLSGIFIGGLIVGPLAENYGRKKLLQIGLLLYIITSFFCFLSSSFTYLLFWRFIEGLAGSSLMVVGWLIVFDKFSINKSGMLYGLVQGVATLILIFVPLMSYWLSNIFNWHVVLSLTSILATISFIVGIICVEETLTTNKAKMLNLFSICRTYLKLLKSFEFTSYLIINAVSSAVAVLYFANASVIFIDHLGVSKELFSYYQSLNSVVYIIFSFLSVIIINKRGIDYTNSIGFVIFIIGSLSFFIVRKIAPHNINIISVAILIATAGNSLMNGFLLKAVKFDPQQQGPVMSLVVATTVGFSARGLFWSKEFSNSTIQPTADVVFTGAIILIILFILLLLRGKDKG